MINDNRNSTESFVCKIVYCMGKLSVVYYALLILGMQFSWKWWQMQALLPFFFNIFTFTVDDDAAFFILLIIIDLSILETILDECSVV